MSQPPQDGDQPSPWARPDPEPEAGGTLGPRPAGGEDSPPGGWGPPSGAPGQSRPYERWGGPPRYGQPSGYHPPAGYGQPDQYGQSPRHGHPDDWGPLPEQAPGRLGSSGGWGGPARPARRPSRLPKLLALAALALLLVFAAVALAPLLGSTRLDPAAVERAVADQFEDREGVALELSCEEELPIVDGATYSCSGRTADGEPVTVTIALTGEEGDYTWDAG